MDWNNNNRYNGQSVRPVSAFTVLQLSPFDIVPMTFKTSPEQLLMDLYRAYKDARRKKRYEDYQIRFEQNLEMELVRLRNSILARRYQPGRSLCFIIHDPKMREVFAAPFKDRVVHHLLYNYIYPYLVPGFIEDSYSCIKGRGTHYGIDRLEKSIQEVSMNYSRPCFILKLDIEGYFMQIDRAKLLSICKQSLIPFRDHLDWPLVEYLLEVITSTNPIDGCLRIGQLSEWEGLPSKKSLFSSPNGCGLPIGNLTSQLFSNVYLNLFDQYITKTLGVKHYGRYVDDAYIVSSSPAELRRIIPLADSFLREVLGLSLNRRKISVRSAYLGVEFLGAYLKPFRKYISTTCLRRMESRFPSLVPLDSKRISCSVNSYLGVSCHYRSYNIRSRWISGPLRFTFRYGNYRRGILRFALSRRNIDTQPNLGVSDGDVWSSLARTPE